MKKFVIIMVSITAVCLIAAVALTALSRGGPALERSPEQWETVAGGRNGEVDQTQTAALEGTGEGFSVLVRTGSDDIQVHYGDEGKVRAHFHGTIRSSRRHAPAPALRMRETSQGVTFWLDSPRIIGTWFYSRDTVMDVYLPASYAGDLSLDTSSGDIRIEGYALQALACDAASGDVAIRDIAAGTVSVQTSSGDISVTGVTGGSFTAEASSGSITGGDIDAGGVDLQTSSGDMRLDGVQGDIEARATSGRIRIDGILGAGKVDAETSSGDIQMSFAKMGSDLGFNASSGTVSLWFPRNAAFGIRFDTASGDFFSEFPVTMQETDRGSVTGYVGSEGNSVRVKTASGDCKINMR